MEQKWSRVRQEGFTYCTSQGHAVRSKAEWLIAEALLSAGVAFEYAKPLTLGGMTCFPDFTIEDENVGRQVYWEHLPANEEYRAIWERKLAWYRSNGIQLFNEANSGAPTLVTTTTGSLQGGFDMVEVGNVIAKMCDREGSSGAPCRFAPTAP